MKTVKFQISDRVVENNILDSTSDNNQKTVTTNHSVHTSFGFWAVFTSTFVTMFFAEMGDKTQVVTLLMSAESQAPWLVFLGAAAALITTSLLGVLIGYWLAKKLNPKVLDLSVAILLLFITAWLISDIIS
ncbi:MAG: TMEM165/GDT1 family protein [Cyanobacteria bacterium P01_F01_bin.143]